MRRSIVAVLVLVGACSSAVTTTTTPPPPTTIGATSPVPPGPTTSSVVVPDEGDGPGTASPSGDVFVSTDLERFRSSTEILLSRDEAGNDVIISSNIASAYSRDPESIEATVTSGERVAQVIGIGETFWIDDGSGWQENRAAEQVLSLTSVTALTPDSLLPVLAQLTDVGVEDVNGRPATHYQGGTSDVQTWLGGSPELDQFSSLDIGSIDVWIDEAGFVSKAAYVFGGTRLNSSVTEYYRASFELYDFDGDFEIKPPI